MRKGFTIALLAGLLPAMSSCVAAIVPALAAGAMGASRVDGDDEVGNSTEADWEKVDLRTQSALAPLMVGTPASDVALAQADAARVTTPRAPGGLRAGHDGSSPYRDLLSYTGQRAKQRPASGASGAVLVPDVDLDSPEAIACADKPPAVIFDLDAEGAPSLVEAQGFQPQPGLTRALDTLRADGVRIVWISDLPHGMAPALRSILDIAGLSSPADDDMLLLSRGGEDRKQLRRQAAATEHCVLAIAGDDYADFDELYDYLLYPEAAAPLDAWFGDGWFLTPPPFVAAQARDDTSTTP